jgi:hypothetical protein
MKPTPAADQRQPGVTSQNSDAEQHRATRNNAHKHSSATQTATHRRDLSVLQGGPEARRQRAQANHLPHEAPSAPGCFGL